MQFALETTWQIALVGFFVFEWIVRLVMLLIIPRRRHPSSATAWLLFIMIFPTIGTLTFLLIGSPKLNKIRRRSQSFTEKLTKKQLDKARKSFPKLFEEIPLEPYEKAAQLAETVGGLPPTQGNDIAIITDYTEILLSQARLIDAAKDYIHLEYFILVMDDDTECIFTALERAVQRGVKVRVLYDVVSRQYPRYKQMRRRFDALSIEHHVMLPVTFIPSRNFNRPDLRNHRKLLVVDGNAGSLGSANIVTKNYHRKDSLLYEEMAFIVKGPIVWQLNTVFRSDWYAETRQTLDSLVEEEDLPAKVGESLLQALPSGPGHSQQNNLLLYTQLFFLAKKRISLVVPYFVPDEAVMAALTAAAKRGVEVTIINSEIKDKLLVGHAQRSFYEELLDVGVQIYLYKKPIFLHNKQVLIDDYVAVVGSSNLDIRSFELNQELSLIIYDKTVVAALDVIEKKYKKHSVEITQKKWQNRTVFERLLDNIARITSALQ